MTAPFNIVGPNGKHATVNNAGALAVAPVSFNLVKDGELAENDIAVNFFEPRPAKQFVVTNVFAYGDKEVAGNTNATVEVYEAANSTTATADKTILKFEIGQNEFQSFTDLNLLVNEGVFINAKTSDDDVHMNILGFFIPDTGQKV